MSDHTEHDSGPAEASRLDHDAAEGGPEFNAPGNEPDANSATEQSTPQSGRFSGQELEDAADPSRSTPTHHGSSLPEHDDHGIIEKIKDARG